VYVRDGDSYQITDDDFTALIEKIQGISLCSILNRLGCLLFLLDRGISRICSACGCFIDS
jgi:hypothetical protein